MPIDFLTRQLERREGADEARSAHDERALAAILDDVRRESGALLADMEDVLAGDDREPARMRVRELRFLAKLDDDLREMQLAELDR